MNKVLSEAVSFVEEVKSSIPAADKAEAVVCAPALFLEKLASAVKGTDLKVGAQNMHFEESGAFTGEISPAALKTSELNTASSATPSAAKCLLKRMKRSTKKRMLHSNMASCRSSA